MRVQDEFMTPFKVYAGLEKRISELKPDVRERLMYYILGIVVDGRILDVTTLHQAILNLEKTTGGIQNARS